ncbi:MAG TPA: cell division protein ZapE [Steroidobacteraceae bacterium]
MSDAPPSATAAGVLQLYRRELAERHLRCDSAQLAVIARLDDLRRRLIATPRAPALPLPRWLTRLISGAARAPLTGLYLWGGVGRGKTWLMDLFFESLPFAAARRTHFHRFMHDVHGQLARIRQQRSPLEHIAQALARDVRVLCFDELYVSDIADAMILGGLFEGLFRRGVTLVATSNVPPHELYKDGLQRQRFLPAIRLIERHLEVARLAGATDYRLRQLTQAGTYLAAGAPDNPARLAALFAALADTRAQAGGVIEIEDRPIAVIRASAGAVWFDFCALCAAPRSQNDYIEIAREYQSVIVADVPVLDAARDDEARRFIALIDELYERNVNLIVSAAAPAAELYRGERLRALFARTASRLIEMQSEEYLAREHRP